uniref:Uncharacterized protein n=1 Tax=Noctiluca scintillans TaxID=2966 RepID=A0A7S1F515_NOCSC|mmetsp:Transcript_34816/g.92974  ORF Transcript_34816/g.92974 Transcript_34816/m.92974 type:complete len:341 (+) Transcript_34816:90-1112(+)
MVSLEARMQASFERSEEMHPLIAQTLHKQRSVFRPGSRIRMNIFPLFFCILFPSTAFIWCNAIAGGSYMYFHPEAAMASIFLMWMLWLGFVAYTVWAKVSLPDPQWSIFLSLLIFIGVLTGTLFGLHNYTENVEPYHSVHDLKNVSDFDVTTRHAADVMDASLFTFTERTTIDPLRSWHFKQKSLYCVAPIVNKNVEWMAVHNFWAVGKDCCSMSSSDFRCGDALNPTARGGLRVLGEYDMTMYRLAVQQSQELYGLSVDEPIFFEWHKDPSSVVMAWFHNASRYLIESSVFFIIVCIFLTSIAATIFSTLGRASEAGDCSFPDDDDWKLKHGFDAQVDA